MPMLAQNKKALHDYTILETYEAGMVLTGQEVKAIRDGNMSLKGAFVVLKAPKKGRNPELYLINAHISRYKHALGSGNDNPERSRKLLLQKREIRQLIGKLHQKGLTMVPIKVYTQGSRIKVNFVIASGKKLYDKREAIKKRENERHFRQRLKANR